MERLNRISHDVIGCAIEVHKELGPGLLESTYEHCLMYAIQKAGYEVRRQVPMPLVYETVSLEVGYRVDLLVASELIIEVKAVDGLAPIHIAQVLTYLRMANKRLGLLLNFHEKRMRDGIRRVII